MTPELKISYIDHPFSSPEEALATGFCGWEDLVMKGYGFSGDEEYAKMQFSGEYCSDSANRIIAVSMDSLVVATMVLKQKPPLIERGNTYHVNGVVVLPEMKGKGIGSLLYTKGIEWLKPDIITGSTKTPAAVLARTRATAEKKMRTFYGYYEVTSISNCGYTQVHEEAVHNFLKAENQETDDDAVFFRTIAVLLPNVPEVNQYPSYVQEVFEPVIRRQREVGSSRTAVMPLISIDSRSLT